VLGIVGVHVQWAEGKPFIRSNSHLGSHLSL
jgi:hypothetical protein